MTQPELKPEELIAQLETELRELKLKNTELEKENRSLKARLATYESKQQNYPSPVTVRTGHR